MKFSVIIPARFASSRFPGKPLADIHGKPMVQHVYERAVESGAQQVVVATDDERIAEVVKNFGGQVCMTDEGHESGTERLAEVVDILKLSANDIVVNVQGDEPFIPVSNILQVAQNLSQYTQAKMATLAVNITDVEEVFNPNAVKVVTDSQGYALYFSRASVPYDRARFMNNEHVKDIGNWYMRHIGIYAYRAGFIKEYIQMQPSALEQIESLEQLRVLWHGEKIHVALAAENPPAGVDTPEDLQRLLALA
ncbi:3-deoxy-manno-octulosonate cytidylyltransferase [Alteromonadaceae bacterium BrNp21-10]|nr:3-deoxy-manno-octulosonate cytidylyltransferase [Alteromonadaceae bacterium BrNp21-10]